MTLARAGQYLVDYERKRYTFRERYAGLLERFVRRGAIILPAEAEHFADISFYQAGMDWDTYALNARAAILRIGQNTWADTSFARFYDEAKARDIALGGYWFFDGRASPDQQLAVIKAQMNGRSFELELFVDWEKNYGGAYEGLPRVVELMQKIEAAGIRCKAVGMYTGYYWFTGNSSAAVNAAQYTYLKQRPLWLAWYASASAVKTPPPWVEWTHWQYGTPSLSWGQPTAEIDANYFNGSRAQFEQRYLGAVIPPVNGGNDMAELFLGTVVAAGLNVRSMPSSEGNTPIGRLTAGQRVIGSEKSNGWWRLLYVDHAAVTRESWAYEGTGNGFIRQDGVIPMAASLPELPWRFEIGDDITYLKQVVNGVLKPK